MAMNDVIDDPHSEVCEINTQDELFALLYDCGASLDGLINGVEAQPDDYLLLEKIRAVTIARAAMSNALKLRSNGDAHRDRLVAARCNLAS